MLLDGFKISFVKENSIYWNDVSELNFNLKVAEKTGYVHEKKECYYNNLRFIVQQSKKYIGKYIYIIQGSFHKFYNDESKNFNDYTFQDLQETLITFETVFKLQLNECIIHNLEIGINIEPVELVKSIIKNIIVFNHSATFNKNNVGLSFENSRRVIKLYDKAKQEKLSDKNIFRIECKIKRSETLKQYQINTLNDLKDITVVYPLINILLDLWLNVLYCNKKEIQYRKMSNLRQKKFLQYINPKYWVGLKKYSRRSQKRIFNQILNEYSTSETKQYIYNLIEKKGLNLTAQNHPPMEYDFKKITASKVPTFGTYDECLQRWSFYFSIMNKKRLINTSKKEGVFDSKKDKQKKAQISSCMVCNKSIVHKRKKAKYCSKKCNNKINGLKRTNKQKKARFIEIENLQKLIQKIHLQKFLLQITYKAEDIFYTDILHQSEIKASKELIKSIKKIEITGYRKNSPPVQLTTIRAKQLIRIINNHNKNITDEPKKRQRKV